MNANSSILITRHLKLNSPLRNWAEEQNLQLIEKAFIKFQPVLHLEIPKTEWVFFSSPNGLELYLENYSIKANKIAVLGEGTHEMLTKLNYAADFIGDTRKTTEEIGKDFFSHIRKNVSVLFPISQLSKKTISQQGGGKQVIELITYKTIHISEKIEPEPGIIIFTSPSNVDSFLNYNQISDNSKVIAFGETTKNHLKKNSGIEDVFIPLSPKEQDLILLLSQLD